MTGRTKLLLHTSKKLVEVRCNSLAGLGDVEHKTKRAERGPCKSTERLDLKGKAVRSQERVEKNRRKTVLCQSLRKGRKKGGARKS